MQRRQPPTPSLKRPPLNRKRAGAALAVLLALVLASLAATAQDSTSLFGEVIDVRVINLEVVVTRGGERVNGLDPKDFQLTVDGKEVPIEYFTEVQGGTAVNHTVGAAEAGAVPALAPGEAVGTSYLVFVDEFFTNKVQRNQVLEGLIQQLPMLTPEDRMAAVAYNGKELEMLTTWTQSIDELTRVLEDAQRRPTYGVHRFNERRLLAPDGQAQTERTSRLAEFEQPELLGSGIRVGSDMPTLEEEQLIGLLTEDVNRVVAAATSTLRSFAKPPGRKVMLLMSGGWPFTPAQRVISDPERSVYTASFNYGKSLYGPLIETANRLSYTLYPIDAPLQRDTATDATLVGGETSINQDGVVINDVVGDQNVLTEGFDNIQDQRTTLRRLAVDTGGEAIFANDAVNALGTVVSDTRSYYWIGFTPQWRGNDEEHKVNVDVRGRGLEVRARRNFSDLSRQTEVTMMVESALRLGDAPTMTPFPARVGEIVQAGRNKVEVPLEMLIPMQALTFLPYEDHYVAEAELRVAAQDATGTMAAVPVVPLKITLDQMPEKGDMRRWTARVKLRKQVHDVVLSLYDNASGTILSTKLRVDPL